MNLHIKVLLGMLKADQFATWFSGVPSSEVRTESAERDCHRRVGAEIVLAYIVYVLYKVQDLMPGFVCSMLAQKRTGIRKKNQISPYN